MFIVLGISLLIVFYIWNKIRVQQLTVDLADSHNKYKRLLAVNDSLAADIAHKSRYERIDSVAVKGMNMMIPLAQPIWFDLDTEKSKTSPE